MYIRHLGIRNLWATNVNNILQIGNILKYIDTNKRFLKHWFLTRMKLKCQR